MACLDEITSSVVNSDFRPKLSVWYSIYSFVKFLGISTCGIYKREHHMYIQLIENKLYRGVRAWIIDSILGSVQILTPWHDVATAALHQNNGMYTFIW
jgi:hypothetical protein